MQRLAAAGLLPLFLMSGALPALTVFRCQVDQKVRLSCCCPEGDAGDAADGAGIEVTSPTVDKAGCCDISTIRQNAAPAEAARVAGAILAPPLVSTWRLPEPPRPRLAAALADDVSRYRATGPPVRLRTSAFLL
jgi:hypothetical protein